VLQVKEPTVQKAVESGYRPPQRRMGRQASSFVTSW